MKNQARRFILFLRNLPSWAASALLFTALALAVTAGTVGEMYANRAYERTKPSTLEQVRELAGELQNDQMLTGPAVRVANRLPYVEELLRQAFASGVPDLRIDVVLVPGLEMQMAGSISWGARQAHERAYGFLRLRQYRMVGLEGSARNQVTLSSLGREQAAFSVRLRERSDPDKSYAQVFALAEDHAVLRYLDSNYTWIKVVGLEDPEVYINWQMAMKKYEASSIRHLGCHHQQFLAALADLRTEVMLARMVVRMREERQKRGVMVVSPEHGEHLVRLMAQLGVRSQVFDFMPVPEYRHTN